MEPLERAPCAWYGLGGPLAGHPRMIQPRILLGIALAASAASCEGGTQATARYAPDFSPAQKSVAVFGVFQAGRMSPEAWQPLSAKVSAALHHEGPCPAAFGEALRRADADLYAKIDEDVAQNGVADEIVETVAGKTDADLIVTFSVHGRAQSGRAPSVADGRGRFADPAMAGRRAGEAGGGLRRHGRSRGVSWSGLEISASLYSVKEKRSVGRIAIQHAGGNVEEAVTLFAKKLSEELSGSTCRGWKM